MPNWTKSKDVQSSVLEKSSSLASSQISDGPSQVMELRYKDWKGSSLQATDVNSPNEIQYSIDCKLLKPHLVFRSPASGNDLATTIFHTFRNSIDINLPQGSLQLKGKRAFSSDFSYVSPAFQNTTLMWTSSCSGKKFTYTCFDEHKTPIARFTSGSIWSCKSFGTVEFLHPNATIPAVRDEIMVTGLSVFYLLITTYTAGVAAAVS